MTARASNDAVAVAQRHISSLHDKILGLETQASERELELQTWKAAAGEARRTLAELQERALAEQEAREAQHAATMRAREQEHALRLALLTAELEAVREKSAADKNAASLLAGDVLEELTSLAARVRGLKAEAEAPTRARLETRRPRISLPPIVDTEGPTAEAPHRYWGPSHDEDESVSRRSQFDTMSVRSLCESVLGEAYANSEYTVCPDAKNSDDDSESLRDGSVDKESAGDSHHSILP